MTQGRSYLIVGPSWVGDMVMAQSLFKQIRRREPDAVIDVLAPAWSESLLARMPEVSQSIPIPVGHGELGLRARYHIGRALRAQHYDRAIIIPRSFKSALIPFFAGAKQRTGYRGEMRYSLLNDIRPLDKSVLKKVVQRYAALGLEVDEPLPPRDIPKPALQVDEANSRELLERFDLSLNRPVIAFMPGAEYGPAKQWPVDHFAGLARQLVGEGYQVWQFGSERDLPVAEQIDSAAENATTILCGKTRLVEAVDLIAQVSAVVTNDSGLMHVAAALDRPLVAIYGSSTPDYTPPLSDKAEILYLGLDCSPCFKRVCPEGHNNCLQRIGSKVVFDKLMEMV